MGLDMYLSRRSYIGNQYRDPEHKIKLNGSEKKLNEHSINQDKIQYITEGVGYWRKANEIHHWFVTECQEGIDDCRETPVSKDDLKKLLSTVKKVLKDPDKARTLLPTHKGFFFGSYQYDQNYIEDLEYTEKLLNEILDREVDHADYFYQSSW